MDMSFYVGALGAGASQKKLDLVSNNLANINNTGFKPKQAGFQELVNSNLNAPRDKVTNLQAGDGVAVMSTRTNFAKGTIASTNSDLDYAISDDNEFFMLKDPASGEISYTRDGHFHRGLMEDGNFYLMTDGGKYVCDAEGQPIVLGSQTDSTAAGTASAEGAAASGTDAAGTSDAQTPGVFSIPYPSRLLNAGDNEWRIREEDTGNAASAVENPGLTQRALENSGTDLSREMTDMIEAQRAFSYALKMVETSDEVEGTINTLRG